MLFLRSQVKLLKNICKIETESNELCLTFLRSNFSVNLWTTSHFLLFKFIPYPMRYHGSLSMEQCWVHNTHLCDMRSVCKTTTRTWRMAYALTWVANEEPAFVELTQLRIHCITLGNNRSRTSPPPPSLFLCRLSSIPFRSGSIFRFAFSSFSLASFLWECDSSFHVCPRSWQTWLLLFLHDVYFHFVSDLLSCVAFQLYSLSYSSHFPSFYRIENHFWHSLSSIKVTECI